MIPYGAACAFLTALRRKYEDGRYFAINDVVKRASLGNAQSMDASGGGFLAAVYGASVEAISFRRRSERGPLQNV